MSPPTSIDGTDITGATIDGTDVQEITVDGDVVFSAVETSDIDGFESGNLNNYTVFQSGFSITQSNVFEGSFAAQSNIGGMIHTDNPPGGTLPAFGTDFEWYGRPTSSDSKFGISFESSGVRSQGDNFDGYTVRIQPDLSSFLIVRSTAGDFDGGGGINSTTVNYTVGRWYKVEVTFSGSTATYTLIDTTNQNVLATLSHSSYSSPGNRLGIAVDNGSGMYDSIRTI